MDHTRGDSDQETQNSNAHDSEGKVPVHGNTRRFGRRIIGAGYACGEHSVDDSRHDGENPKCNNDQRNEFSHAAQGSHLCVKTM